MTSTAEARVGNLPLDPTSFVGRRREVADAKRMLAAYRLVTLTGPGGVGKTRLALKVAGEVRRAFCDGVWLGELGELQDPALLVDTLAESLGLREQPGRPLMEALEEYLAQRRVLLVLDNCEHLVDTVAVLAAALLRSCPELRVVATSREPLGIGGEVVLAVQSLSVPDPQQPLSLGELSRFEAVALFADRAAATVPGFAITEDNQLAVVEICRRLDGLPLAIELASVRLRALSAEDILRRLSDNYLGRMLRAGRRDAPARQQTLRSCIEWSYDLCSSEEQLLWARLAVFAGGFELDAAEGICTGDELAPEDLLDVVASLVDKSILVREERGAVVRYRMLETIREFGREQLEETADYTTLRRRHRDWYNDLVARAEADWISPRQVDWSTRLNREHPNIRAALEFSLAEPGEAQTALQMAAALRSYWTRGLLSEGRHWLDQALARDSALPTTGRVRALYTDILLAGLQGDLVAASALLTDGRDLAERLDDAWARALITQAAGNLALVSSDIPQAAVALAEVLDYFRAEGNIPRLLETLVGLVLASGLLGDTERAAAFHEEVLAITEPRGEVWYRGTSLWALGVAIWRQGDLRRSAGLLEQSLQLKRGIDDVLGSVWCLKALAWIAADEHQARRAATLLGAAESFCQAVGTPMPTYPDLLVFHERCRQQTRRTLGDAAFEAAFSRGSGMRIDDAIAFALDEQPHPEPTRSGVQDTVAKLTRREHQVAELLVEGLSNREIAARLVISQRTAEGHVENILVKLGFTSRAQIAAWAARQPEVVR